MKLNNFIYSIIWKEVFKDAQWFHFTGITSALSEECSAITLDAEKVSGIKAEGTDVTGGTLNNEGYKNVAKQLTEKFGLKYVEITLRESFAASDNG